MDDQTGDDIELARIVITKSFEPDAEGGMGINVEWDDELGFADALGMLEFAKWSIMHSIESGLDEDE